MGQPGSVVPMWGTGTGTGRRAWVAVTSTLVLLATGCGGDGSSTGAAPATELAATASTAQAATASVGPTTTVLVTYPPNGQVVEVQALDNTFRVEDITVEAGTEVRWTNVGRNQHNVVAIARTAADVWGVEDVDFQPGQSYSHVFDHPGVFEYVCTIHGVEGVGMIGSVTVTG